MRADWGRLRWVLVACGIGGASLPVEADHYDDSRARIEAALAAFENKDYATLLTETIAANTLRADHPTFAYYLAVAQALNGDAPAAAAALERIAGWGLYVRAEDSPHFAVVAGHPAVQRAFTALRANHEERGTAPVAFALPAEGGLWEGIACDPATGDTFHSDLHHARIIRRDSSGQVTPFATMPGTGFGSGGMAIDPIRHLLWVSSPAMPEVAGFSPEWAGQSRLVAFDLTSGAITREIPLADDDRAPESTVVDVTVAPDGTVYAADSASPVIWRVPAGSSAAEVWAEISAPGARHSLQGATLSDDANWLFVADYSTGLHAVSVATGETHFLDWIEPMTTSLLGIDGLVRWANDLFAVQNGVNPVRLIRIGLRYDEASARPIGIEGVETWAANTPGLTDPTLLGTDPAGLLVIGDAGWAHFGESPEPDSALREVPILRLSLKE